MWKCPSCKYKTTIYKTMMKHYYAKHHTPKKGTRPTNKGKEKKIYRFKPLKK